MIAHHFHHRAIPDEVCPPEGPGIHWQGVGIPFAGFFWWWNAGFRLVCGF